jgi:proteasome lid subunit RPN8/RPN11
MTTKGVLIAMTKHLKKKQKKRKVTEAATVATTQTLRFSPTAWAKLLFLRDYGDTEVGGFGIAASDDRQVDAERRPEQFARIWVHTHPGDCPRPSMTDEETFERVFGRADWAVMFILDCEGQSYARLRFNVGPCAEVEIPVGVDYSRPFSATEPDTWEQEYLANVHAEQLRRGMASTLEPVLASPFDEEPTDAWYESWFDYAAEEEEAEELIL